MPAEVIAVPDKPRLLTPDQVKLGEWYMVYEEGAEPGPDTKFIRVFGVVASIAGGGRRPYIAMLDGRLIDVSAEVNKRWLYRQVQAQVSFT